MINKIKYKNPWDQFYKKDEREEFDIIYYKKNK